MTLDLRRTPLDRLARLVTEVFAPSVLVIALPLAIAAHHAPTLWLALAWAGIAAVFGSIVPMAFILRGVRRGALTDHHVRVRDQRPVVLGVCLGSVALGLGILVGIGAARELVVLVAAEVLALAITLVATLRWGKVSIHAAVAAGAVAVLAVDYGPALLGLAPLPLLIGWSRVRLGDHTGPEVVHGLWLGALIAAVSFGAGLQWPP